MKRLFVAGILVLAFAGIADSAYLAQHELEGTPLICNVQNVSGCNTVANSPYAYLFGIPLAVYGVLFYSVLFILAALELALFDKLIRRALQVVAVIGFLASVYFTILQVFFIGAFCIYCIASAVISLFVLVLATCIEPLRAEKQESILQSKPSLPMPPLP